MTNQELDDFLLAYAQRAAIDATQAAGRKRKGAVAYLTIMAASDAILQRALLNVGVKKLVKMALGDFRADEGKPCLPPLPAEQDDEQYLTPHERAVVARTGGLYAANHPNED